MTLTLLLALQAAAPPAPAPEVRPISFDLARYRAAQPDCGRPTGSDILICGRRPVNGYPLDEMARLFEAGPLVAEIGLGGTVRGAAFVESVTFPGGMRSNRVMVGIKMPF
jgi:hypothetical protein